MYEVDFVIEGEEYTIIGTPEVCEQYLSARSTVRDARSTIRG